MEQQTLFKVRDRRKKGWFWLDNDYLNGYARYFGAIGTAIYVSLCRHADNDNQECFPAIKTIAEENNIGESTVKQFIKIFEKYRILEIKRERDPITKRWSNNIYRLLDKDEWIKPEKPLKAKRKSKGKTQSQSLDVDSQGQSLLNPEPKPAKSQSQSIAHKEDSIYNKTHIKEAGQSPAGKEINDLIDKFREVNPAWERLFANKSQRAAIERLLKKAGREKLEKLIETLPQTNQMRFAPVITTPIALENKLGDLIAFIQKEQIKVAEKKIIKI